MLASFTNIFLGRYVCPFASDWFNEYKIPWAILSLEYLFTPKLAAILSATLNPIPRTSSASLYGFLFITSIALFLYFLNIFKQ